MTNNKKCGIIYIENKKGTPQDGVRHLTMWRAWKVYGVDGHRQKKSFEPSVYYDWSERPGDPRIVAIANSDTLGTNEYSIISICRATHELCEKELIGQITDGLFEECRVGKCEEI